jgi:hypothetical protein
MSSTNSSRSQKGQDDDRFATLLKKWEQEGKKDLEIANKEKLDFLNKVD